MAVDVPLDGVGWTIIKQCTCPDVRADVFNAAAENACALMVCESWSLHQRVFCQSIQWRCSTRELTSMFVHWILHQGCDFFSCHLWSISALQSTGTTDPREPQSSWWGYRHPPKHKKSDRLAYVQRHAFSGSPSTSHEPVLLAGAHTTPTCSCPSFLAQLRNFPAS